MASQFGSLDYSHVEHCLEVAFLTFWIAEGGLVEANELNEGGVH